MFKNIDYGLISLIVLFIVPLIKDYLRDIFKEHIRSWSPRSIRFLKVIYGLVLIIPLIIGILDYRANDIQRKRNEEIIRADKLADDGRNYLHEGLKNNFPARIDDGKNLLKEAINILENHPFKYNKEIQARHDLALGLERIAYSENDHGCKYHIDNDQIVAEYVNEKTNISVDAKFREIKCTNFDFTDADQWYKSWAQYNKLYERLMNAPKANSPAELNQLPAALRSTGYFFMCDNLRVGGQSLKKAEELFLQLKDITDHNHQDLKDRHDNALDLLAIVKILNKQQKIDRVRWSQECFPKGTAETIQPETENLMKNSSWYENMHCPGFDELKLLRIPYWGFDNSSHQGEMVVSNDVADDVLKVFKELFVEQFPIEKIERIDHYRGNDDESMKANNTSAFNCRRATGKDYLSTHSYGTAIDINPIQNPYVKGEIVLPPEGKNFLDRNIIKPGMVEQDSVISHFKSIGWKWGGDWESHKDYQHFSKNGD